MKNKNLPDEPCGKRLPSSGHHIKRCPNPAVKPHRCPYRVEILEDQTFTCRCCDSCRGGCAEEV